MKNENWFTMRGKLWNSGHSLFAVVLVLVRSLNFGHAGITTCFSFSSCLGIFKEGQNWLDSLSSHQLKYQYNRPRTTNNAFHLQLICMSFWEFHELQPYFLRLNKNNSNSKITSLFVCVSVSQSWCVCTHMKMHTHAHVYVHTHRHMRALIHWQATLTRVTRHKSPHTSQHTSVTNTHTQPGTHTKLG
jgi:hypothetical protein